MIGAEQSGQSQNLGRVLELPVFQVEQAQIQKQLPIVKAETDRLLILGKLVLVLSHQAVGKAEVVMGKGVVRIPVEDFAMKPDSLGIIFHPKVIVGDRIANLLIGRGLFTGSRRKGGRLENQYYQDGQSRTITDRHLPEPASRMRAQANRW